MKRFTGKLAAAGQSFFWGGSLANNCQRVVVEAGISQSEGMQLIQHLASSSTDHHQHEQEASECSLEIHCNLVPMQFKVVIFFPSGSFV